MLLEIVRDVFSSLFGKCTPVAVNDYEEVIQIKYNISELDSKMIYVGLLRLKKRYQGRYRVRVLFVDPGILQIILGTEKAVSSIGNTDFKIDVC